MNPMDGPVRLGGIAASPGVAIGRARCWVPAAAANDIAAFTTPEQEITRLADARRQLAAQFRAMRDRLDGRVRPAQAEIFDVQIALLDDPELIEPAHLAIREAHVGASAAFAAASDVYVGEL